MSLFYSCELFKRQSCNYRVKLPFAGNITSSNMFIDYTLIFFLFCRQQEFLQKEASYIMTDPEVYSLHDLLQVKSGEFFNRLKQLVDVCSKHVLDCEVSFFRYKFYEILLYSC